jgi:hypothetical protein
MIDELELVTLTTDISEYKLRAGDIGTVVFVHAGGAAYIVEFIDNAGDTIAVVTVDADQIRPLRANVSRQGRRPTNMNWG